MSVNHFASYYVCERGCVCDPLYIIVQERERVCVTHFASECVLMRECVRDSQKLGEP